MSLRGIKVIYGVVIFALCFFTHFGFDWWPNVFTSIFFPVNESIWEHMKMITSSILLASILDFILLKYFHYDVSSFLANLFICLVLSIILFLLIYMPFYYLFGALPIINIGVLIITIILISIISYFLTVSSGGNNLNLVCFIGIILLYIMFTLFTYCPPKNEIFYDFAFSKYGISDYSHYHNKNY